MKFLISFYLLPLILWIGSLCACESEIHATVEYPAPQCCIEYEIDSLLSCSEEYLFTDDFSMALTSLEKAESLLGLTAAANDHRKLRCSFDKALIVTCIEGVGRASREQFSRFETLLASKRCSGENRDSQPNLFDRNGNWPVLGENEPIGIGECIERVSSVEDSLAIACVGLSVSPAIRIAIEAAIYVIAKRAKLCCTERGFWKNCIQPVVDSWKRVEIFGIHPDPYWD